MTIHDDDVAIISLRNDKVQTSDALQNHLKQIEKLIDHVDGESKTILKNRFVYILHLKKTNALHYISKDSIISVF